MPKKHKSEVIQNSKKNQAYYDDGIIVVRVTAPPTGNKANKAVVEALSKFLNVKKGDIRIAKGLKSRHKIIEIA